MAGKNIHYHEMDSAQSKTFDAKDDNSYITLKTDAKNWVNDSLLGKTIFGTSPDTAIKKIIAPADTLKPVTYFVYKQSQLENDFKHTYTKSIFSHHQLIAENITPIFRQKNHSDWGLTIFLVGFSLLAIANFYYIKRFNLFAKAFFLQRFTSQLIREDNSQTQRLSIILSTIYLFAMALFAIKFSDIYGLTELTISPLFQFIIICIGIFSFFVFKIVLNYFVGSIFKVNKEINEYVFNIILLNQFLGIALFLLSFILYYTITQYSKFLLVVGVVFILSIYAYRIVRGIIATNNNKNISAIYLFLYFCTLEILPMVLITKLMLGY